MSNHKNYRVVSNDGKRVLKEFITSQAAFRWVIWQKIAGKHEQCRVECYVYGWGWVRWSESMQDREVAS